MRDTTTHWLCSRPCKNWCWARSLSASSRAWLQRWLIKPAPATSACAQGLRLEGGGTRRALPAAVVPPTMWPCFGRQAPAVTRGNNAGDLLSHPLCGSAKRRDARDYCCRPRGGEGKSGIARNLIAGVQGCPQPPEKLKSSTSSFGHLGGQCAGGDQVFVEAHLVATMFLGVIKRLVCPGPVISTGDPREVPTKPGSP